MEKCIILNNLYKLELINQLKELTSRTAATGDAVAMIQVDGIVNGTMRILDNMTTADILDLIIQVRNINGQF